MTSAGATFPIDLDSADGQHFLVVVARYYAERSEELLQGAVETLNAAQASFDVVSVPGVLEIPSAIAMAIEAGDYDGFIALGLVLQNEPIHVGHIVPEVSRALLELSVVDALPIGNGLLSADNDGQAHAQTASFGKNIGAHAARAAIAMAALKAKLNA